MKARRLIEQDGKYNIIYFGSKGQKYRKIEKEYPNLTTKKISEFINKKIILFPYLKSIKDDDNQELNKIIIIIRDNADQIAGNPNDHIIINFDALNGNQFEHIEYKFNFNPLLRVSYDCSCEINLIDQVIKDYKLISNFTLEIHIEPASIALNGANISISYYENCGDLEYTPQENNIQRNDPNYYNKNIAYSYSSKEEGVRDSLIARLDLIKGELCYRKSYGLPLLDKIKSKGIYDSIIVGYIMDHPDVVNLEEFSSNLDGHKYKFDCKINTIYNEEIELSN